MSLEYTILSKINDPQDLKALKSKELKVLAAEIRERIIDVVSKNGGHLASNLGVVELAIALHKIYDSPHDAIVWDVGHQCYPHKILTGRNASMDNIRQKDGISGFPKRTESLHDVFDTGHSSTSISAALGILAGKKLTGDKGKALAVIGDGSMTGGMAFEALNHAGYLKNDLVVVLNDNNMSISPNVGALSSRPYLGYISSLISRFTISRAYTAWKKIFEYSIYKIPFIGPFWKNLTKRIKKGFKALLLKENIFSDLGFEYVGPINGHNLKLLEKVFRRVKRLDTPVVVHVRTVKGRGYEYAEGDPTMYHGVSPFSIVDGKFDKKSSLTYTEAFSAFLLEFASKNQNITAITAAMGPGTGLSSFQARYPKRFFDVGIAEQHAVTFAGGLAVAGMRPVVAIYSTFMQRAVDQLIHDVAIPCLPVMFVASRAGLVDGDGETHQGVFDVAMFRSVPNMTILAPAGGSELGLMMEYCLTIFSPSYIRLPKSLCSFSSLLNKPVERGRGIFIHKKNSDTLLVVVGGVFEIVEDAGNMLGREGIVTDVYNQRFIKPVDEAHLFSVLSSYKHVVLAEDASEIAGFGEYVASFIERKKITVNYHYFSCGDFFPPQATRSELFEMNGITAENICEKVKEFIS
ncbi:MAG: 1-deoxy-D-xylulose-5-phosphate synthase [Spirochaetales bacterium]|nr:1-deoxy-D-xylulose-5-phosphate synthase [Spirochaetales bacterium]